MCGISGIINNATLAYQSKDLLAMTNIVTHRGPDDEGYCMIDSQDKAWVLGGKDTPADVYGAGLPYSPTGSVSSEHHPFKIALGHRRLSIIDLSVHGHLPMSYDKQRYWITFNGEIYNYQTLKKELQSLGHQFISQSDTEVILAAYGEWGPECLQRFNGMWAFAIYDNVTKEIFLARDRFGIKPLYYRASPDGTFCFASEIKQFTVLPGWKSILNRQRAYDYLLYNLSDHTDETLFDGVFQIQAGHYFKCGINQIIPGTRGNVSVTKWYNPVYKAYTGSFEEAAAEFRQHFKNSISEHLIADVPLGSALSGGLDSSAIVCEINEVLMGQGKQEAQTTFSYISSDEKVSEQKWVDAVTAQTNVTAHYVHSNGDNVFRHAANIIWYNDEPNQSQSHLVSWQVYRAAKENNITVLMSGQGADEYISGYEAFMNFRWVQLLKKFRFKRLSYEIINNQTHAKLSLAKTYLQLCYFLVPRHIQRYFGRKTRYHEQMQSLISVKHLQAKAQHPYDLIPFGSDSIFNIASRLLMHYPLQKYLHFDDRLSMSNSVESRVPFLDHRLVEFTMGLPVDYLDGLGETKKIMKHGLKDILPEKIRNRTDKMGFITAEEQWVKTTHTKEFRQMLEQSIANSGGIIKPEALAYFDELSNSKLSFDYTYWRLIAFGTWMEKFKVTLS